MLIVDCTMQKECKNGRGMHVWHDISFGENPLRLKKHQVSPKSFGLIMLMLKGKHHKNDLDAAGNRTAQYILRLRKETRQDFILNDGRGNYQINPKYLPAKIYWEEKWNAIHS